MLPNLLILTATSIVLLSGCVGWKSSADESGLPVTQVGAYKISGDRLSRGGIEAPAGVTILPTATKDKLNGTILLEVVLLIPERVSVRLLENSLKLQSPEWAKDKELIVHHIADNESRQFPATGMITGTAYEPANVYTLWYSATKETMDPQTGIPQVGSFTVTLPTVEINGRPYQPAPVTFDSYRKCGLLSCN